MQALLRKTARAMIEIPLSTEDLTKVRIAPSPLWETITSFGVLLHHHGRDTVHAPWVVRARRVLPGTDILALVAAMCVAGRCPDFLTPPPDASGTDFGDELERLRTTPSEVVHEGVALGDSRASVLKSLLPVPTTTAELARQLDLAPAAVSAHLSRLKDAGLVEPHRNGKRVYYRLSCAGKSLLRIFGETS